jgi:predicted O-methyltransferase YrrM
MIKKLPKTVEKRLVYLENLDEQAKSNGTYGEILWQIPRETAEFVYIMAASAPKGKYLEIGTGGGYSALWIGLACRIHGRKLETFEYDPFKAAIARVSFNTTGMEDTITLIEDDALNHLVNYNNVSFCFLDTEDKGIYLDCYNLIVPKMVSGGIFIADNATSHKFELRRMFDAVFKDERVDAIIVPIGKGELVCRKI